MLKNVHQLMAALAVSAILPSLATTQPIAIPKDAPAQVQTEHRVKQILGTKVHIQGNIAIGTVDDIVFSDDGRIEYLLVLNDGKYVTVPWKAATFNFEKQLATLNITQEQYRVIPNFGLGLFPRFFAPTYRVETYRYYGLTPEQERRLERAP